MKNKKIHSPARAFLDMVLTFVIACVLFVGFRYFIRFPVVSGTSMEPTYHDGDRLAVFYTKDVKLNDIVVSWSETLDEYIVKRVIGMPGDKIEITAGALYRNGTRVYESYVNEIYWDSPIDVSIELKDDQYFLLGDNRNHSMDSRSFGAVPKEDIFGKVITCVQHKKEQTYE